MYYPYLHTPKSVYGSSIQKEKNHSCLEVSDIFPPVKLALNFFSETCSICGEARPASRWSKSCTAKEKHLVSLGNSKRRNSLMISVCQIPFLYRYHLMSISLYGIHLRCLMKSTCACIETTGHRTQAKASSASQI